MFYVIWYIVKACTKFSWLENISLWSLQITIMRFKIQINVSLESDQDYLSKYYQKLSLYLNQNN